MIRSIFLNGFIAICTIIVCILIFFSIPFDRNGRIVHFYFAVPWAKLILGVCGVKVRAWGQENLDARANRIYMTNHQSYFDIFVLLACLTVDFKFIMKQELMKIPLFGFAVKRAGYIGIQRDNPRKAVQSINEAVEKMKSGVSVLIFPEGTRGINGRLQPFKRGGFNLALRSGCDIVPVAISNSYRIVPKGSLKINKGSIDIHIGRYISVKGYNRGNITQLMDKVKNAMLKQIHQRGIDQNSGSKAKMGRTDRR